MTVVALHLVAVVLLAAVWVAVQLIAVVKSVTESCSVYSRKHAFSLSGSLILLAL
jgi:hypothetical protein